MALSNIGKHRVIGSQAYKATQNVEDCITEGTLNGTKMPLKCLLKRGDCHWYWKRPLGSIQEQGSDIEKEVTVSFATQGKSQLRKQDVAAAADDSDGTEKLIYPHRL